jgi:hypothetical protein
MDYENNIKPMKHRIIFQVVYYVFTFIGMFIFNYNFLNFLITGGVIALVVNVGTFDVINDGWWYAFKYGFVAATWVALIGIERMLPRMLYNNLWNSFWFAPLVLLVMAALMGVVTMVILNDNEGHGGLVICGMLATAAMLLIRCYTLIGRAYEFDFGMFMYYIIFTAVFLGGGFIGMSIGFGLGQVVDDNT